MHRWVEVDVIDMPLQIVGVTYQVFPGASLPHSALLLGDTTWPAPLTARNAAREEGLEQAPAQ
ncbi:hypothetical protein ACFPOA_02645 [Lysobacter niabensis]|uniref:hypothetical protein n=1 Tax=Agrilutibacter niabensis TaxID=380628 RepID=UPI00360DCB1A